MSVVRFPVERTRQTVESVARHYDEAIAEGERIHDELAAALAAANATFDEIFNAVQELKK